jgi:hypothetical protein
MAKDDGKYTPPRKQRRKRRRESDRREQLKRGILKRIETICDRHRVDPLVQKALLRAVEREFRRQSERGHPQRLPKDMPLGDLNTLVDALRLVHAGKEKSVHTALRKVVPVALENEVLNSDMDIDPKTHVSRLWNFYKRHGKNIFEVN